MKKIVHVAVGVIERQGKILLAKRADHQHQGGLWEFPGGKVEQGEHVTTALVRELQEELAIHATQFHPLIKIRHDYGDKEVLLDVWMVTDFTGQEEGKEGQPLAWTPIKKLNEYSFPAANQPIVNAVMLPKKIAITPPQGDIDALLDFTKNAIKQGADGLQLRAPHLPNKDFWQLYDAVRKAYSQKALVIVNSRHLIVDGDINSHRALAVEAVHFTSQHAPLAGHNFFCEKWRMAACHNSIELEQAETLGIHAALLSPVAPTSSHPGQKPLGWPSFSEHVDNAKIPVYALGGMQLADFKKAQAEYAQGIAGISFFKNDGLTKKLT